MNEKHGSPITFLRHLSEVKRACLNNFDLSKMFISHFDGTLCNLSRYTNFDEDNRAAFIKLINLRRCEYWSDEKLYKLREEIEKKWGV